MQSVHMFFQYLCSIKLQKNESSYKVSTIYIFRNNEEILQPLRQNACGASLELTDLRFLDFKGIVKFFRSLGINCNNNLRVFTIDLINQRFCFPDLYMFMSPAQAFNDAQDGNMQNGFLELQIKKISTPKSSQLLSSLS